MKDTLSSIIIFAAGASVGAVVTWKFLKTKYEQIAQEEIDSVKEYYRAGREPEAENEVEVEPEEEIAVNEPDEAAVRDYSKVLKRCRYDTKSNSDKPYVISPDEFGELEDYETQTLTYYVDGTLIDDITDEPIEDVDDVVGVDSLNRFGEYEECSVFVRNDRFKCDYEILLDKGKPVEQTSPHDVEE